jgi:murein DD-endopeptidase MepM/ murein hydrolase activator NlpD
MIRRLLFGGFLAAGLLGTPHRAQAQEFLLPTANHALFEPGGEERFFVGTAGKNWTSGMFGSVRSNGQQIHEGLDIRCLQRDSHGEPTDPVMATADGTVAYINNRPSLSNYGNYIVLKHSVEGMEIDSLYAHLSRIAAGLQVGQTVKAGQVIAIMGHTSNTSEPITKDRAHVHFELNLFVNERFPEWYRKTNPNERNDHGMWNGRNLNAIDSRRVFLDEQKLGSGFSLVQFLRTETNLCHVFVRSTDFPWLHRYAPLVLRNPVAEREGVAGYEIALDFNGVATQLIPRAASEIKGKGKYILLSVDDAEEQRNPGRHYVTKRSGHWELAKNGIELLDLLTM